MTHGGGPVHRHAGSMGSATDPSRIFKGKIGAGHMGAEQVTVQNLDVVKRGPRAQPDRQSAAPFPAPRAASFIMKSTVKIHSRARRASAGISNNPQKASARANPQKASARNR